MSTKINHILDGRLDAIKKELGYRKDTELADWLGCSRQSIQNWKSRGSIGNYDAFTKRGVSEVWLRTGEGEMFNEKRFPHGTEKFREFAGHSNPRIEEAVDHYRNALGDGGSLTPTEINTLKMLRWMQKNRPDQHQTVIDQLTEKFFLASTKEK